MLRGPLYQDGYPPQFSGHETFPIRYGWLKKAFDAVHATEDSEADNREVFTGADAIGRFGVGKNMVASMRHWATVAGVIEELREPRRLATTALGRLVFSDGGLDPFMEDSATAWLIHWRLCGNDTKTTWFWAFHHFPFLSFERDTLVQGLEKLAEDCHWTRASPATIRRDVSCFTRTYVAHGASGPSNFEDGLESPLTELGLIRPTGRRDGFRFVRGPKPTLGAGVFGLAVTEYWNRVFPNSITLSFEALAHEPGCPGRAFQLEDNDVVEMLMALEESTRGVYQWSETAGLKQLIRIRSLADEETLGLLARDYTGTTRREMIHAVG